MDSNAFKSSLRERILLGYSRSSQPSEPIPHSTPQKGEVLGQRKISVLANPGHQDQAITFYDHHTKLLLTGDTIYPGRLYVRNWQEYKDSIKRIVSFTENHPVAAMLGAHIEISKTSGVDYSIESTYQPDEASLVLTISDLTRLNSALHKLGDVPKLINLGNMIIYPLK